jgi:hypothetical protein
VGGRRGRRRCSHNQDSKVQRDTGLASGIQRRKGQTASSIPTIAQSDGLTLKWMPIFSSGKVFTIERRGTRATGEWHVKVKPSHRHALAEITGRGDTGFGIIRVDDIDRRENLIAVQDAGRWAAGVHGGRTIRAPTAAAGIENILVQSHGMQQRDATGGHKGLVAFLKNMTLMVPQHQRLKEAALMLFGRFQLRIPGRMELLQVFHIQ